MDETKAVKQILRFAQDDVETRFRVRPPVTVPIRDEPF
jgi:hypothetical protein